MRILMTSDGLGGVGVIAGELARALARRHHRVRLLQLGPAAAAAPDLGEGVEWVHLPCRLEWMGDAASAAGLAAETERVRAQVAAMVRSWHAELLHANHFAFAGCAPATPTLLGVHSDVFSWWRTVRGQPPPDDAFHRWYDATARAGLEQAQAVVAPTRTALDDLRLSFGFSGGEVISHGCAPEQFRRGLKKKQAVTLARLWDAGKQIELLRRGDLAMPVAIAGEREHPVLGGSVQDDRPLPEIEWLGPLPRSEVIGLLARARVYIGTSRYEPFGLAPLEAAFCGCALLLNDIPSFREVWGPAACYFVRHDGEALARELRCLADDVEWAAAMGEAAYFRARRVYTAAAMAAAYERLYTRLLQPVCEAVSGAGSPPPAA